MDGDRFTEWTVRLLKAVVIITIVIVLLCISARSDIPFIYFTLDYTVGGVYAILNCFFVATWLYGAGRLIKKILNYIDGGLIIISLAVMCFILVICAIPSAAVGVYYVSRAIIYGIYSAFTFLTGRQN